MNLNWIRNFVLLSLFTSGCVFSTQEISAEEQLQESVAKIDPENTSVVFVDLQNVFVGRLVAGCATNGLFSSEKHDAFVPAVQAFAAKLKKSNAHLFQTLDYHPNTHISFQDVYKKILDECKSLVQQNSTDLYFAVIGGDTSRWVVKLSHEVQEQLSQNNICVMVEVADLPLELEQRITQNQFKILTGFDSTYFQYISEDIFKNYSAEHNLTFRLQPTFMAHSLAVARPQDPTSTTSIFTSDIISDDCSVCKGCYSSHDSFSGFDSFARIYKGPLLPFKLNSLKELKDTLLANLIQPFAKDAVFRNEVYAGCATDICLFATVRDAVKVREQRNANYRIIVVKKYCSAFDAQAAEKCLEVLASLGVEVVDELKWDN